MKSKKLFTPALIATLLLGFSTAALASKETPFPRSMADKGKYYLLEVSKSGGITKTLHKRVGVDSVGFSRTEINCIKRTYRDIGYGEDSQANITNYPSPNWADLIPGSSKSDLANFVCR